MHARVKEDSPRHDKRYHHGGMELDYLTRWELFGFKFALSWRRRCQFVLENAGWLRQVVTLLAGKDWQVLSLGYGDPDVTQVQLSVSIATFVWCEWSSVTP